MLACPNFNQFCVEQICCMYHWYVPINYFNYLAWITWHTFYVTEITMLSNFGLVVDMRELWNYSESSINFFSCGVYFSAFGDNLRMTTILKSGSKWWICGNLPVFLFIIPLNKSINWPFCWKNYQKKSFSQSVERINETASNHFPFFGYGSEKSVHSLKIFQMFGINRFNDFHLKCSNSKWCV